jgi:hypothetical protein
MMFNNSVFGYAALIVAALNLLHPSVVLFTVGLLAGGAPAWCSTTGRWRDWRWRC